MRDLAEIIINNIALPGYVLEQDGPADLGPDGQAVRAFHRCGKGDAEGFDACYCPERYFANPQA